MVLAVLMLGAAGVALALSALLAVRGVREGRRGEEDAAATALGLARVMLGLAVSLPVAWALIVFITGYGG